MKFVIAQMKHETNTFSPVPTPLFAFGKNGPYFDRDAFNAMKGTATPMGAFIDRAIEWAEDALLRDAGAGQSLELPLDRLPLLTDFTADQIERLRGWHYH